MKTPNRPKLEKLLVGIFAALGALLMTGCAGQQVTYPRIAVAPMYNRSEHTQAGPRLSRSLTRKLSTAFPNSDVILLSAENMREMHGHDPLAEGTLPLKALTHCRQQYSADAVVIGAITNYHPYWNMSLGVRLKVIDTGNATVIARLSRQWDAGSPRVQKEIQQYYRQNRNSNDCRFGPDLFTVSPRYFMLFVAHSMAREIEKDI
jgi:hypothetical protein